MIKKKTLKNLDTVACLIKQIIKDKKSVLIYGDSDVDGSTSVFLLREIFRDLSAVYRQEKYLQVYFPDRSKDGYGINQKALKFIKKEKPDYVFTVDCGIGNVKEVSELKEAGIPVIIIDHHRLLEEVPKALVIVDPHQPGEEYPFHDFSNAGLIFKLAEILIAKKSLLDEYRSITALANIADQVPDRGENFEMTMTGLKNLLKIKNLGVKYLIKYSDFENKDRLELIQKIIQPLNSGETVGIMHETFLLLSASNKKDVEGMINVLIEKNQKKQEEKRTVVSYASYTYEQRHGKEDFIIVGNDDWKLINLGAAASEIMQKYKLPTFLYSLDGDEAVGSARLPKGFNGVEALKYCKELLITYGGHPPACGFRLKKDNLKKFEAKLKEYFSRHKVL